jgi:hypothetical protein
MTTPEVVSTEEVAPSELWIHDETDRARAFLLAQLWDDPFPRPFGVLYADPSKPTYEELFFEQVQRARQRTTADLPALLRGRNWWHIGNGER